MTVYVAVNTDSDGNRKGCKVCGDFHPFITRSCVAVAATDEWPGDLECLLGQGYPVVIAPEGTETTTIRADGTHIDYSGKDQQFAEAIANQPEVVMTEQLRRFLRLKGV